MNCWRRMSEPVENIRRQVQTTHAWEGEVVHHHKNSRTVFVATLLTFDQPIGLMDTQARPITQTNNDVTEMKRVQNHLARAKRTCAPFWIPCRNR